MDMDMLFFCLYFFMEKLGVRVGLDGDKGGSCYVLDVPCFCLCRWGEQGRGEDAVDKDEVNEMNIYGI